MGVATTHVGEGQGGRWRAGNWQENTLPYSTRTHVKCVTRQGACKVRDTARLELGIV